MNVLNCKIPFFNRKKKLFSRKISCFYRQIPFKSLHEPSEHESGCPSKGKAEHLAAVHLFNCKKNIVLKKPFHGKALFSVQASCLYPLIEKCFACLYSWENNLKLAFFNRENIFRASPEGRLKGFF